MSKYILWDLDGTLVESEDAAFKYEVYRNACAELNLTFLLEPHEFVGNEGKTIFPLLLERNNLSKTENYAAIYSRWNEAAMDFLLSNIDKVEPRGNIIEIWKKCTEKGIKHAIVTNNREDITKAYLRKINLLHQCETLVCCDNMSEPKPSPMPYLTALNKLNISNRDCIVVEDSVTGVTSATRANIYTIAWVKEINPKFSIADLVTDEIDEHLLIHKLREVGAKSFSPAG